MVLCQHPKPTRKRNTELFWENLEAKMATIQWQTQPKERGMPSISLSIAEQSDLFEQH
jgi:hypothetical protein